MDNVLNMNNFIGVAQGDEAHMLGKFLYFSLSNLLVKKEALAELCEQVGLPYTGSKRTPVADAFRSATGDINERVPVTSMGETNIYLAYCRDNKRAAGTLSRELVKETLNRTTNQYEKLANISYDKGDGIFRCENMVMDPAIDVRGCCRKAEELFELYKVCANRRQVETICAGFLRSIEATKLNINGHLYFVPRLYMEKVDVFEDFVTLLGELNLKEMPLAVNSFFIRPLAKLSKAIEIADTSNQGEAKRKTFSAVTVTLGQNAKPLHKTYCMFHKHTSSGNLTVYSSCLLCQRMSPGTFLGQAGVVMQFLKSLISGICLQQSLCRNMNMGFFEQPEIMFSPIRKGQANNLPILEVYQHLHFQCVLLFLPRIVPLCFFWVVQSAIPSHPPESPHIPYHFSAALSVLAKKMSHLGSTYLLPT